MFITDSKIFVFIITFLAYSAVHSSRSVWSYSKNNFQQYTGCSKEVLGHMDASFLIVYAVSLNLFSQFGDKLNLKFFITIGMIAATICLILIGIANKFLNIQKIWIYPLLMALNGFCQSTQWPGLLKTMGNWFGKGKTGLLIGVWSGNSNFGNIIGYQIGYLAIIVMKNNFDQAFLICASFYGIMSIILIFFLKTQPKQQYELLEQNQKNNQINNKKKKLSIIQVLKLKGVINFQISYLCLKSCAYGFLFWLPTFLNNKGFENQSMFDIGSFIGMIFTGYITDKIGKRCILMWPMLLIAAFFCFIVKQYLDNQALPYYILIFLIGVFLGGPYQMISSVISIDLSQQQELQEFEFLSTLSGIIEGTGSLGSALLQIFISYIDIDYIFWILMGLCILGSLSITKYFINDLRFFIKFKK